MSLGLTEPLAATVELAERVLARPAPVYRFAEIQTLAARVKAAAQKMIEGGNPIGRETTMLFEVLELLEDARMQRIETAAAAWWSIGETLLGQVRETLFAAMRIEHARPSL